MHNFSEMRWEDYLVMDCNISHAFMSCHGMNVIRQCTNMSDDFSQEQHFRILIQTLLYSTDYRIAPQLFPVKHRLSSRLVY